MEIVGRRLLDRLPLEIVDMIVDELVTTNAGLHTTIVTNIEVKVFAQLSTRPQEYWEHLRFHHDSEYQPRDPSNWCKERVPVPPKHLSIVLVPSFTGTSFRDMILPDVAEFSQVAHTIRIGVGEMPHQPATMNESIMAPFFEKWHDEALDSPAQFFLLHHHIAFPKG